MTACCGGWILQEFTSCSSQPDGSVGFYKESIGYFGEFCYQMTMIMITIYKTVLDRCIGSIAVNKLWAGGRHAMPRPSPPLWAPKRIARPSRRQYSSSFSRPTRSHAHRCSCMPDAPTRQWVKRPVTLTFDLLTLKVVSESRVTWAISVPILVFLGFSVLDLGSMYATDRQTDVRRQIKASLNVPAY